MLPYFAALKSDGFPTFLKPFLLPEETGPSAILLSFAFSTSIIASTIVPKRRSRDIVPLSIRQSRLQFLSLFSMFCFAIYMVLSVAFAGSLQDALIAAYTRVRTNSSLANVRSIFFWGNIVFTTFAFYGLKSGHVKFKIRILIYLSVVTSMVLAMVDGGRAILILFVLSLFARPLLRASVVKMAVYGIVSSAIISIVSYFMLNWRYMAQGAQITARDELAFSGAFTGLTFVDHFQLSIQYTREIGFDFGVLYLNSALSFLPRAIFPGKATPLSAQMRGYLYGDEMGGIPPGLFGEGFIFAGAFGLVIVSVLYGRALLATARLCKDAKLADCPVRYAAVGITVPLVGFTLVRGGLDIGVLRVGLPFLWTAIAIALATGRRDRNDDNGVHFDTRAHSNKSSHLKMAEIPK